MEEGFDIAPIRLGKHEKHSRLTGLEYPEINARKKANPEHYTSQRCKQQSLDPISLDYDNMIFIPKHPALSICPDDKDILVIPPRSNEIDEFIINHETSSGVNLRLSRPYYQEVRMTEDPRLYLSKSGMTLSKSSSKYEI